MTTQCHLTVIHWLNTHWWRSHSNNTALSSISHSLTWYTAVTIHRHCTVIHYSLTYLDLLVLAGNTRSYRVRNHRHKVLQAGNGLQPRCFPVHKLTVSYELILHIQLVAFTGLQQTLINKAKCATVLEVTKLSRLCFLCLSRIYWTMSQDQQQ